MRAALDCPEAIVNEKLNFALAGDLAAHLFGLRFLRVMTQLAAIFFLDNPIVRTGRQDMNSVGHF